VEFHLLYSGPLHSAGDRQEKHTIRKVFHSQLRQLWWTHPNLKERAVHRGALARAKEISDDPRYATEIPADFSDDEAFQKGLNDFGDNWNRNGFSFLPLVTEALCLRCSLDILFLRREEKNYILQGGDIDGRLKTLFDSLRMIGEGHELPPGAAPEPDETPFFCLLEDDKLISEVHVKTGPLLMLPGTKIVGKHDVYLQIAVRLNATQRVHDAWVFD
jgi:hypothetical protein